MKPDPTFTADDLISLFKHDTNDEGKTTYELITEMGLYDTSYSRREVNKLVKAAILSGRIRVGRAVRYDVIGRRQHVPVYVLIHVETH